MLQAEAFEEFRGGLVEEGAAGGLGAARQLDEAALQQGGDDAIDGDAADRLDVGAGDRLAISDDGEGLQRGLAQFAGAGLVEELADPGGGLGPGAEAVAARQLLDDDAPGLLAVFLGELGDDLLDPVLGDFTEEVEMGAVGLVALVEEVGDLPGGHRLGRGEEEGLDDLPELDHGRAL